MAGRIRLHINAPFKAATTLSLSRTHAHYLMNVMRLKEGDPVHVFNGHEGEWRARFVPNKRDPTLVLEAQVVEQAPSPTTGLIFSPIKPKRMEFLVEKATELNVGNLYPTQMERTVVTKVNVDKVGLYAAEAAEQSERLSVPVIHTPQKLPALLQNWDKEKSDKVIFWAAERQKCVFLPEVLRNVDKDADVTFLIGPEGGFSDVEKSMLEAAPFVRPVSLGPSILRVETAALVCLSLMLQKHDS